MKKILALVFALVPVLLSAQTASDFTIDDIDGNSRNLFTELDENKVVVLKFFTNWCPICNNTADEVVAIYNGFQTNGDPVVFWALDRDQNETNADATTYRNNNNIPFPVIGEAYAVAQQFGVQYQPEYYIIRPDRSYVKRTSYTTMQTAVNEALASFTSVDENTVNSTVQITANSIIWLESPEKYADLMVLDASGKMVVGKTVRGNEKAAIDLPAGVYIYRLTNDAKVALTGKLSIVR